MFIKGKKREMLIDDVVGNTCSRATSALEGPVLGGLKGKRSDRERDLNKDNVRSNSVSGASRPSLDGFRSERKTKAKPKQKNIHLSVAGSGFHGRFMEATEPGCPPVRGSNQPASTGCNKIPRNITLPGNIPKKSSKESEEPNHFANLQLPELDSMEALGVSNDIGGPQDLSSWLNFDEDGLQDHDSIGLEIPMDDLTELHMF